MKHNTLAITTDFGDSFATAQLHAVIDSFGFNGKVIENHSTAPFAIHSGAFEILTLCKFTKPNTVFLGVIDPGVGSERAGIIIKTKNYWFVGPDNGLLYPAAKHDGIEEVWKINENFFPNVTKTFHGRDVFIKSALYLAMGKNPNEFGSTLMNKTDIVKLKFREGQVLHVDAYGNLKVFTRETINVGSKISVCTKDDSIEIPIVNVFDDVRVGEPLAYRGSSNTLELAINQGSFAKKYNIHNEDILSTKYTP